MLMPSVTQPDYSMVSPAPQKKRRREDEGEVQSPLNPASQQLGPITNSTNRVNSPLRAVAVPKSKKYRRLEENDFDPLDKIDRPHAAVLHPQQSFFPHAHPDVNPVGRVTTPSALLSPCHVCHRKPTKKSDLDSFSNCMGCSERTCFVCLRECQGWVPTREENGRQAAPGDIYDSYGSLTMQDVNDTNNSYYNGPERIIHPGKSQQQQQLEQRKFDERKVGSWNGHGHREVICSQCCIERGSDGEVVCLGCLAGMEGA